MKKIATVVFALLVMLALTTGALAKVPAKPSTFSYIVDYTDTVSARNQTIIGEYGEALREATGYSVVGVVVNFLDGMEAADYATDIINQWGIGSASEDDGVVVLLAVGDRQIQIGTGSGIDRVLTAARCGELIDNNLDYFADNKFDQGMASLYVDVCNYLASARGKTLNVSGSSTNYSGASDPQTSSEGGDGVGIFSTIITLLIIYFIVSAVINGLSRNRGGGGCLNWLFMGWLFNRGNRRSNRNPPRPPMGGYRNPPRPSSRGTRNPPRPSAPRSRNTTSRPSSRSPFGGSGSSFGGSSSRSGSSFGGGSSRSGGSFGGGSSRGGGAGRKF